MNAAAIARALGGRKTGSAWMARCPAHEDREPSLSIDDSKSGKVLVRCHAGCDQRDVIAALRWRGIWQTQSQYDSQSLRKSDRLPPVEPRSDSLKRSQAALAIWQASQPADESLVEP